MPLLGTDVPGGDAAAWRADLRAAVAATAGDSRVNSPQALIFARQRRKFTLGTLRHAYATPFRRRDDRHQSESNGAQQRQLQRDAGFVRRAIEPATLKRGDIDMTTAADILKSKADTAVYTIEPAASVADAVTLMAQKNIGALLVVERGQIVGILTERDVARSVVLMPRSVKETPLRDIMATSVMIVPPEHTSEECMALMTEHRVRHLPVMDGSRLIGIVSIGDLVKGIISEQQFIIEQLEHYISGQRG
jgi:CBS domain-containing protein